MVESKKIQLTLKKQRLKIINVFRGKKSKFCVLIFVLKKVSGQETLLLCH